MLTLLKALWRVAVNPVTFVVLCLLWCLDLGLGSLLAYARPDLFGTMDAYPFALWLREVGRGALPQTAWVYLLAALTWAMTGSLALCTVTWFWRRRGSLRGLGEVLVHLGFLMVFAGFVVEASVGTRVHGVEVPEGGEVALPRLGITLRLARLALVTSAEGDVLDTVSELAVGEGQGAAARTGTARLNHPLIAGATVVYPRGHREVIAAARLLTPGGALRLAPGDSAQGPGGRRLALPAVLQPDEERAGLRGPAVQVALLDAAGRVERSVVLAPAPGRTQALLAGVPVVLDALEPGRIGRYDVHRDPGARFVLFGGVLIFAGTLWAFASYLAARRLAPGAPPVPSSVA